MEDVDTLETLHLVEGIMHHPPRGVIGTLRKT